MSRARDSRLLIVNRALCKSVGTFFRRGGDCHAVVVSISPEQEIIIVNPKLTYRQSYLFCILEFATFPFFFLNLEHNVVVLWIKISSAI